MSGISGAPEGSGCMVFDVLLIVVGFPMVDRAIPQLLRMYAVGVLPWAQPGPVEAFYKQYGWIRFPRTALLVGAGVLLILAQVIEAEKNYIGAAGIVVLILYIATAAWDVWKAGRSEEVLTASKSN